MYVYSSSAELDQNSSNQKYWRIVIIVAQEQVHFSNLFLVQSEKKSLSNTREVEKNIDKY